MEKSKIERINELARKQRSTGLSDAEKSEQYALRSEYLAEVRASFGAELDNTVIKRPDGSIERLTKKDTAKQ